MDVQNRREIFIVFTRAVQEGEEKNTPISFCHTLFRIRLRAYFTADDRLWGTSYPHNGIMAGILSLVFYSSGRTERVQPRLLISALDKLDMRVRPRPGLQVYTTTVILSPNFCASGFPSGIFYPCPIDFCDVARSPRLPPLFIVFLAHCTLSLCFRSVSYFFFFFYSN